MAWQPLMSYGNIVDLWWVTTWLTLLCVHKPGSQEKGSWTLPTVHVNRFIQVYHQILGFNWWAENVNHCQGLSQVTGKHWLIIAIDDISHTGQYNFNWMLYWVKRVHTNFSLMFDLQCNYMLFFLWLWLIGLFVSFSPDIVTSCSD